jgi:hypothetical protein
MLCVVLQILVLKFFGAGFQQLAVSKWQLATTERPENLISAKPCTKG